MANISTYGAAPRHGLAMVASDGRSPQDLSSVSSGGTQQQHRDAVSLAHKSSLHQMSDNGNLPTQYIVTIAGDRSINHNGIMEEAVYQSCCDNDPHSQHVEFTTLSDDHMQQHQHYIEYADPSAGQYYTSAALPLSSNAQISVSDVTTGQFPVSQGPDGRMYFVHDDMSVVNGAGHAVTSAPRASPATVQWLLDNYEAAEGVSLPRSTLYNHYLRHCAQCKLEPMNPASFGKLIRSVFLGLRTRRLGTRGCSKYHYYGIALKASSNYNGELIESDSQPATPRQLVPCQRNVQNVAAVPSSGGGTTLRPANELVTSGSQHHLQYLGDACGAIPNFGHIELTEALPDGITMDHLRTYEHLYVQHCEAILHVVVNLQFSSVESLWKSFWNTSLAQKGTSGNVELLQHIPLNLLRSLCCMPSVVKYTTCSDFAFYQALIEVLIPDVLRPIPSTLTQVIRNFAKSLETSLKSSMTGVPDTMVKAKACAVCIFAQTLRRYTSLNHLAQAARAVLQNSSQVQQMLIDLNRIDFGNIQEQASWVCQCDDVIIRQLEADMKTTLEQQNGLEHWAKWLESVLDRVLVPDSSGTNFTKLAQQFLLKWSFYCSMIIRDLTLRSAASFGSFHLIRLLFDEYMFYLVEHKIAVVSGCMPLEAMANCQLMAAADDHLQTNDRLVAVKRSADGTYRTQSDSTVCSATSSTAAVPLKAEHSPSTVVTSAGVFPMVVLPSPPTSNYSFPKPMGTPVKLSIASPRSLGVMTKPSGGDTTKTVLLQTNGSAPRTVFMVPVSTAVKPADNSLRVVDKRIA